MATSKTPGVYVEEIPVFPPSVAQAPTSITAFIGYTEKYTGRDGNELQFTAFRVGSLLEYSSVFGKSTGNRYLYDAITLFYNNGGGECYIISIGKIDEPITYTAFENGLNSSKKIAVQIIAVPDSCLLPAQEFSAFQQMMLQACCDLQDRFAILDTLIPAGSTENDIENFRAAIGNNNLKWGAAYYPWLVLQNNKLVPPSGAIAGVYAKVDSERGIWKAPANVPLTGIKDISVHITEQQQQNMNVDTVAGKSVNALRNFPGKGFLIWGARTLAGNDNEWRYVPVHRFFIMIEQSLVNSTGWAVFEPNNANTWVRVKSMIENYLTRLWRSGALAGTKPEQAFYVSVGLGISMTALDIQEGRLVVETGLAVVRPAEFIILRFSHKLLEAT